MVADGYWLNAGAGWHRVTLHDYLDAMNGAGLRTQPVHGAMGLEGIPRDFTAGALAGTTSDPNLPPANLPPMSSTRVTYSPSGYPIHSPGRTVTAEEYAAFIDAIDRLSKTLSTTTRALRGLMATLGPALTDICRMLQEAQWLPTEEPTPTSPSGEPTPTPSGPR